MYMQLVSVVFESIIIYIFEILCIKFVPFFTLTIIEMSMVVLAD